MALTTFVSALKRDPTAHRVFTEVDGASLLVRILSAETACLTSQIFNVIASLIFSNLEIGSDDRVFASPLTCIVEPLLLKSLICSSNLWTKLNFKFWASLLQLVNDCLCETPYLESIGKFNFHQLKSISFLDNVLNVLLVMVRSPDKYPECTLSTNARSAKNEIGLVSIINELVDKLLESPVNVKQLPEFWNFIQLSHPPADTHVDKLIRGRNSWIQTGKIKLLKLTDFLDVSLPEETPNIKSESELAIFINELCQKHPKSRF